MRRLLSIACLLAVIAGFGGCTESSPPPVTYTAVMSRMELITAPEDDGQVRGLNLDDHDSTTSSPEGCFKDDFSSPYGVDGVDNQLALLGTVVREVLRYQGDFSELVQGSINDGRFILMMQIEGVDDPVNDDDVTLHFFWGDGPMDVGNDGRPVPGQSFDRDPMRSFSTVEHQRIVDGHIEGGGFEISLPVNILLLSYDLPVEGARYSLDLDPETGVVTGMLGGGVPMEDVIGLANATGQTSSGANTLFSRLADLDYGDGCTHMSAAFEITAVSAFVIDDQVP